VTETEPTITAFVADRRMAHGDVVDVARKAKRELDRGLQHLVRLFDDRTGRRLDLDFEGSPEDVAARAAWLRASLADPDDAIAPSGKARGRGRPRLGVVAKEITLLPRHWAWLSAQRGSASATLRRLVDDARRASEGADRVRAAQDAAYRFMYDSAGDAAGFEEALRSLYAGDEAGFEEATRAWPEDVSAYARRLAADAFPGSGPEHPQER
jgi:hypothetical protein